MEDICVMCGKNLAKPDCHYCSDCETRYNNFSEYYNKYPDLFIEKFLGMKQARFNFIQRLIIRYACRKVR